MGLLDGLFGKPAVPSEVEHLVKILGRVHESEKAWFDGHALRVMVEARQMKSASGYTDKSFDEAARQAFNLPKAKNLDAILTIMTDLAEAERCFVLYGLTWDNRTYLDEYHVMRLFSMGMQQLQKCQRRLGATDPRIIRLSKVHEGKGAPSGILRLLSWSTTEAHAELARAGGELKLLSLLG